MEKIASYLFADEKFLKLNGSLVNEYVEYKIHGYHSTVAMRAVFGEENFDAQSHDRIVNLEASVAYREKFKARQKAIPKSELWNPEIAMTELMAFTRNPYMKETVRLNALKELNVLLGITIVDENGKTKAGRSLEDFYSQFGIPVASGAASKTPTDPQPTTNAPEPKQADEPSDEPTGAAGSDSGF